MASIHGPFPEEIIELLVSVGIILGGWPGANDDSPTGVRGEDQDGVVNCSELTMDCSFHLMPLMHLESVVSDVG